MKSPSTQPISNPRAGGPISARARALRAARILALTALATAGPMLGSTVQAQEIWIGRPTVGDYLRHSMAQAIHHAADYRQGIAGFQSDITRARREYFQASDADRPAKADAFGELLFAKDLMLAIPVLTNGFSDYAAASGQLLAALGGGAPVDGGIRPIARESYDRWLRAMRKEMGARNDTAILLVTADRLQAALSATAPTYQAYRRDRDLGEARAWRGQVPQAQERTGQRPLRGPGTITTIRAVVGEPARMFPPGIGAEIAAISDSDFPVLKCEYGPFYSEQGNEHFADYYFWQKAPPANIARILAFDNLQMGRIRDHVAARCPATEAKAITRSSARPTVTISDALRREVQATIDAASPGGRRQATSRKQEAASPPPQNRAPAPTATPAQWRAYQAARIACQQTYQTERQAVRTGAEQQAASKRRDECLRKSGALLTDGAS